MLVKLLNRDQRTALHTCTNMHSGRLRTKSLMLFKLGSRNGTKRDLVRLLAASQPFSHSPAVCVLVCHIEVCEEINTQA